MIYIAKIIDEVQAPIDTYVATIIYGSAQLFGCWLSTLTTDRFGRRPLLLLSCSSVATCHCILGVFFLLQSLDYDLIDYSWLPILAFTVLGFSFASGLGPLTALVCNEMFNPEFASICNCILITGYAVLTFILLKVFPLLVSIIGFHNCFFIFVATCTIGFFVILIMIPETRGRSIESIRNEMEQKKDSITPEDVPR
uniref:Major facilitator superfamily (MFS) profile domain-containing protein n=1 Tax=Bracon brevicornis TaxID=1563983 RepID=A0A6V7IX48_9HYME